jgi:hypothetical protein
VHKYKKYQDFLALNYNKLKSDMKLQSNSSHQPLKIKKNNLKNHILVNGQDVQKWLFDQIFKMSMTETSKKLP